MLYSYSHVVVLLLLYFCCRCHITSPLYSNNFSGSSRHFLTKSFSLLHRFWLVFREIIHWSRLEISLRPFGAPLTHTHTHTHTHKHTQTYTNTRTHTHTHRETNTQTARQTDTAHKVNQSGLFNIQSVYCSMLN